MFFKFSTGHTYEVWSDCEWFSSPKNQAINPRQVHKLCAKMRDLAQQGIR